MNLDLVKSKISDALFRCDLFFHLCSSLDELSQFCREELNENTDAFLICGGDGTVNTVLQCMIQHKKADRSLPPICLVSSGTANDLAHEIDISHRIDEAARLLLEGREKKIDLIEVESANEKKYMLTNGGIGIPALAALKANDVRNLIRTFCNENNKSLIGRTVGDIAQKAVKRAGSMVYSMTLLKTISDWKHGDWHLEVEVSGKDSFTTRAPFLLVNNQSTIGQKFLTAPYTSHNDGLVNLLVIESNNKITQLEKVLRVYMGNLKEGATVRSLETPEFKIRAKSQKHKITFFGDGEILFRDVDEVKVRCLKKNISVMVRE
jgi:diacylglycerol kinase family enzyme